MYRIALDCVQVPAEEVVYIDDRAMFVEIAQGFGIQGIVHTGFECTRKKLKEMGLEIHS
jgi:putative hydrolase of the HAD superfamily